MPFSKLLLIVITVVINSLAICGYGQHSDRKIDSLKLVLNAEKNANLQVDLMNEIAKYYRFVQLDKGLEYAESALGIAEKNNYQEGIATANYNLGANYFYQGDYSKSLEFYSKALEFHQRLNDKKAVSNTRAGISSVYFSLGEYNKSLELFNQILQEYRNDKNTIGVAQTYSNIGTLFSYQGDDKKGLEYYLRSETEFRKANYTSNNFYSITLTNIGLIYFDAKEYKKAEYYFQESIEINTKIGNLFMVAKNLCSLGDIYFKEKDFQKAEDYHNQSLQIGKQMNNEEVISYNHGDLGRIFFELALQEKKLSKKRNMQEKAIDFLRVSTEIFKNNGNINSYQQYTRYLADAYKANGNYQKALESFQEHSIYKDSLFNEEKRKEFTRTEVSFEFAKREDSIRFNNEKEIAIKDATLTANTRQKWLLFGGVLILGSLGILLFYQNQSRKRTNEKLSRLNKKLDEANQIKTRFFGILNHDLRSPVSNIIKFIRLLQNNSVTINESTRLRLESQTIESAENLLNSMDDLLLWSKGQMKNFKPKPKWIAVDTVFVGIEHYFKNVENVSFSFQNPQNLNLFTDENYVKTILRNLTSNAVNALKLTPNPEIVWKAKKENNIVILSITDNGPGGTDEQFRALYDEKQVVGIKTGLGLHLIRDMAKAIHCQVIVETNRKKGTTIFLNFLNTIQEETS